ncbi:MAG: ABC transporter substrate-binding protein [Nocardioidaceae bacterium]
MQSKTRIGAIAAAVAMLLPLSACGSDPTSGGGTGDSSSPAIVIGSANFPENQLLAEMYSQALEAKGVKVTRKFNIGARELYLKALKEGSINMIPEYNGALLAALSQGGAIPAGVTTTDQVNGALKKVLPSGLEILKSSPAEDKDTLSVSAATAQKYSLKSIADLKPVASKLAVGAASEFKTRSQGLVGLKKEYGITFGSFKALDAGGPLTKTALTKNQIQVGNIFSTDSTIVTDHLVVLDDPKNLFAAQNITPVIEKSKVKGDVGSTIDAISAALTTKDLTKYLAEVAVDKKSYNTVAKEFLSANSLD